MVQLFFGAKRISFDDQKVEEQRVKEIHLKELFKRDPPSTEFRFKTNSSQLLNGNSWLSLLVAWRLNRTTVVCGKNPVNFIETENKIIEAALAGSLS